MSPGQRISFKGGYFFGLAFSLFLPIVAGANTNRSDSLESGFPLTIRNDRISARIDQVPLHDILTQLARHFRFKVHFQDANSDEVISAFLKEASLEEALDKLLIGKDYAMVKSQSLGDASLDSSLGMLFVVPRGTGRQSPHQPNIVPPLAAEPGQTVIEIVDSADNAKDVDQAKVQDLAEDLLVSNDPREREAAVELLADMHSPEVGHLLRQALGQDPDAFVRERAAEALGDSWDPQHVDLLTETLFKDPDVDVRKSAAEAMGEIGAPEVISALGIALNDPSPEVRERVVGSLGDYADPQAISLLRRALDDPAPEVRKSAAYQLETLRAVER